ncbi:MAG TPA: hypothetical protein VEX15_03295 [Nocardioidaceae bacterium]|nr:hypothetical protein [Nocardioidaceae bacterium]
MNSQIDRIAALHQAEMRANAAHRRLIRTVQANPERATSRRWRGWRRKTAANVQPVPTFEQLDARPVASGLGA